VAAGRVADVQMTVAVADVPMTVAVADVPMTVAVADVQMTVAVADVPMTVALADVPMTVAVVAVRMDDPVVDVPMTVAVVGVRMDDPVVDVPMTVAVVGVRVEVVPKGVRAVVVRVLTVVMVRGHRGRMAGSVRSVVTRAMQSVVGHSLATSVSPLPMNRHPCVVAAGEDLPVAKVDLPHVDEEVASPPLADSEHRLRGARIRMQVDQRPMSQMPISTVRISMRTSRKNGRCVVGETSLPLEMSKVSRIGSSLGRRRGVSE
jgi:hypothetical protein